MWKKNLVIFLLLIFVLSFTGCSKAKSPIEIINSYDDSWEDKAYSQMYESLSAESQTTITAKEFEESYEQFYTAIGMESITIDNLADEEQIKKTMKKEDELSIPISVNMVTTYGTKSYDMEVRFLKEKIKKKEQWNIKWDYAMIYPDMEKGDTVETIFSGSPVRGDILDRNGNPLAQNGTIIQVGIVPGRLGDMKDEVISDLVEKFSLTKEYIEERLNLSWVKEDSFVDLIKISKDQINLIEEIHNKNNGATYKEIEGRVYPFKDITAHLTGYIGYINEEELEKLEPQGFTSSQRVGRTGFEKIFDEALRGIPGKKISITDKDGKEKEVLLEEKAVNGKNLELTIDIELQSSLYSQLGNEQGTATTMDYNTGEVLALVSAPAYDPNQLILGVSSEDWTNLQEMESKPMLNRFTQVFSPGSTLKPITAAIALNENKADETFSINVSGLDWQKDSSWGSYYVTRVSDSDTPIDMEKAIIYSDNIYFAQLALKIGSETFLEKAKSFGIGEDLKIRYGVKKSQLASKNKISSEILLADTGYGQGEVLLSILNLPKAYSAFVNEGNIIEPKLVKDDAAPISTSAISKEVADKIFNIILKVVEDENGTAHNLKLPNKVIAAKTGTAEINTEDENEELGWFVAIDKSDVTPYITAMMIEQVQGRGGSHLTVAQVKKYIEDYMNRND
jgi:penicillin-binding protein 3